MGVCGVWEAREKRVQQEYRFRCGPQSQNWNLHSSICRSGGLLFMHPSSLHPSLLPPQTTTCLQATTSVPREMSATEKKAHKGLTFHMAGSPRLKRPDNPRRLD